MKLYHPLFRFRFCLLLLAVSLFAWSTAPLWAQPVDDDDVFILDPFTVEVDETSYVPDSSVVASGFAIENINNPIVISSLSDKFIEDLKFDDLADAAGYMSSTVKSPESDGSFHGSRIRVRGFATSWFNRNGVRRYVINGTDNLDRLEVVKGPAAVFFGQAAPGGLLNYVTKRPDFTERYTLQARYGSYDYKRLEVGVQGAVAGTDWLAYRVNASYLDKEDWRDFEWQERRFVYGGILLQPVRSLKIYAEYEHIYDENNDALALPQGNPVWMREYMALTDPNNPVVDFYAADPTPLALPANATREQVIERLQGRWRRGGNGGNDRWRSDTARALGVDESQIYFENNVVPEATPYGFEWNPLGPGGWVEHELENTTLEAMWTPTEWFSLRATSVWDNAYRRGFIENYQRFDMSPEGPIFPRQKLNHASLFNESITMVANGVFNFTTGFAEHTILLGVDRFEDDLLNAEEIDRSTPPASEIGFWNYFTQGYHDQDRNDSEINITDLNHRNIRTSYYLNYVMRLWDERVVLMGGVRDEGFERVTPSTITENGEERDTLVTVLDVGEVTPSMGTVIRVVDGLNFFASYSESFDANGGAVPARVNNRLDEEERARFEELLGSDRFSNPSLGKGYDIGFKYQLMDGRLNGTLTYFSTQETNRFSAFSEELTFNDPLNAEYLAANPDARATDLPIQRNRVFGETKVRGLEFDALFQPIPAWSIIVSYSHYFEANAEKADGGELRIIATPDNRASIWNKYEFDEGFLDNFSIGFGAVYSDDYLMRPRVENQNLVADSYLTFDALFEYEWLLSDEMELLLSLNIRNVTDEIHYGGGGLGAPADTRKFFLSGTLTF